MPSKAEARVDFWMGVCAVLSFIAMVLIGTAIVCAWWGIWPAEWTP